MAFDSPHTYGRRGALWYQKHHAFARILSAQFNTRVHAYAIDPEEFEQVATYACGRAVGGDGIRYDDVDPPGDGAGADEFEVARSSWPLGHLARILGVTRADLIQLPRSPTVLLELEGEVREGELADILPPAG